MMHEATKRGFKDCPKCAPLAYPLNGHRWGTGPKKCPARARRTKVPPWGGGEVLDDVHEAAREGGIHDMGRVGDEQIAPGHIPGEAGVASSGSRES